jgi:glycosyltransferase involved in cell wall biosynthesis
MWAARCTWSAAKHEPLIQPATLEYKHSMNSVIMDGWFLTRQAVGMAVYAQRLVDGLQRHAKDALNLRILLPSGATPESKALSASQLIRRPFRRTGSALLDQLRWQAQAAAYARIHYPDAVYFSPAPLWARRAPRHTVVAVHDCIHHHFPRYQGRRFLRKWLLRKQEKFLDTSTAIVTESQHAAQEIHTLLGVPQSLIHTIPAWLPPHYAPAEARAAINRVRARYALPERYWLYVGGYDYRKNVDLLLEAYARVNPPASCPPLVLAGHIPQDLTQPVCRIPETLARLGLGSDRIIQPGFIASDDMPGLYAAAELFVYPSLAEGFGLPPMEAMGCGCPALCADNTSLPEVVRDTAYRFESTSIEALSALLARAADTPLPVSPAFSTSEFDEAQAIRHYVRLFSPAAEDVSQAGSKRHRNTP